MKKSIFDSAHELQPLLVSYRRELHKCPELRMDTPVTEGIIVSALTEMGVGHIRCGVGGHGVVALITGGMPGPCLAIRMDMDGLPIREETGLPFASENGNMHACGHDAHSAMGLGAAKLLLERCDELRGSVKLIFQPYEEGDGGAKLMIADGVLESPHADAILGMHIGSLMGEQYDSGDVVFTDKPDSANIFAFKAEFFGKSSHVCQPHYGIDPIYMACNAVIQLQEIMSRERDPNDTAILSVSTIHGGVRNNIIPDSCTIEGSIRSFDRESHARYCKRAKEICEAVALGMRGKVEFTPTIDLMATRIDKDMFERFSRVCAKYLPKERVRRLEPVAPSGEDFARYADMIPAMHFFLCSKPKNGECYPHHHPKFDINEDELETGAALLAAFALDWTNEKEALS